MKIALIQQHASTDRQDNRLRGLAAVRKAAQEGARIIGFAELALDRFYPQTPATPKDLELAEPVPGPTTDAFCALAEELGVVIVMNVFERGQGDPAPTYDSSPVIDADGSILGITRMVHITDYEHFHEQGYYTPGDQGAPVYETRFGRIGVAICYDRHYPEYMRALAIKGADMVFVPQAGPVGEWPDGLYEAEMQVAAFQNGYFTALCNRVGKEENLVFAGESFVCAPDGQILAKAGQEKDEILFCDLNLEMVVQSNARRLFLRDRRPELYGDWI
jgi:predicted amidohydrolase